MLGDLNRALKNPSGDFVDNKEYTDIDPTQKIPTLDDVEIKKEKEEPKTKKKHKGLILALATVFRS